ncbi:hypothetical protein VTN77DRAFT_8242 [Rasamsonia byssochlamydoides]|uniref:uncharacterized protein n=1 Tax=Rasamsonia byssochlamydoides TaxID=89139 RepID=UPI003743F16E
MNRNSRAFIKTPKPHPHLHEDGEHPRVPKFIEWDSETRCLTMEYLDNGNLGEDIQQHSQKITAELRRHHWARQAAEGLDVLHSAGVVHCNISPRNFLLEKISDFGGASLSGPEPSAMAGTRFRDPDYNWDAPPVFGDDIFSLGSLIYFIMTGSYPYEDRVVVRQGFVLETNKHKHERFNV